MEEEKPICYREEIVEYILNLDNLYRNNPFLVENVVTHTLNFLENKGAIRIEKNKKEQPKKQKVDVF